VTYRIAGIDVHKRMLAVVIGIWRKRSRIGERRDGRRISQMPND
jgi:hypothetical protein